jgi:hypothetical protein
MKQRLGRLVVKLSAVATLVAGAAWLTGCCCCGPSIPDPGGEYSVMADGRSALPDLEELRAPVAAASSQAMGY